VPAKAPDILYRIGRYPDALKFPPWEYVGGERFDDPERRFRVLYTAEQRIACFVEALAPLRSPSYELAEILDSMPAGEYGDDLPQTGIVPADWHLKRLIGQLRLGPEQQCLDLRSHETLAALHVLMASDLRRLEIAELDMAAVQSHDYRVTQAVAQRAYSTGYKAVAYTSRLGADLVCWAIFEEARFERVGVSQVIKRDDQDLVQAAARFGLEL